MDNTALQEGIDNPNKAELFQWILHLLRLVTTVSYGFPAWKLEPGVARSSSRFHTQSYGYLDALTTLLLRRDEVIAAVESLPGSGVVMSDNKSKNHEVRWPFYLYHLAQITPYFSQKIQSWWIQNVITNTRPRVTRSRSSISDRRVFGRI